MVEAGSKLARFVGLDAYAAAGGTSRTDLFGDEVYLEKPALLHRLAEREAGRHPQASWKPKAGAGSRSTRTATGTSSTAAAGFSRG